MWTCRALFCCVELYARKITAKEGRDTEMWKKKTQATLTLSMAVNKKVAK